MDNKQVAQELIKVAKELTAGSEIPLTELPIDRVKLLKKVKQFSLTA